MHASTNANLFAAIQQAFPAERSAVAIEAEGGLRYSWQDLDAASAMVANLLESLGLPVGARLVAQVDKSVEALILYLATLRAGWVYVPLNTAYQTTEMQYFLQDAQPAVLVCAAKSFAVLSTMAFLAGCRHVFVLNANRTGSLLDRAALHAVEHTVVARDAGDVAAIIYTSGTTGRSKGAMLSHGNLLSNARVLQSAWQWRTDDVLVHALPIFHIHGLFVAVHAALLGGSRMRWLAKFDAVAVLQALREATVLMGVPTFYVRLLQEAGLTVEALASVRLFISGSAPLLPETFAAWQVRTGHAILERYGMSETVILTTNPCNLSDGPRVAGTVGRALPEVTVRVCDDAGQVLATGETGHIQVRGPGVFQGYWHMPEKTAQDFTEDGFFKTGDVGYLNADAYLTIVGRSKDLFITGGYNVYPAEVEAVLNGLEGVQESAVVGVPHADLGEVGVAFVVLSGQATKDTGLLLRQLNGRLAYFKVPKHCHVLPDLPRNAMGKVQKTLLREKAKSLHFSSQK